MNSKGLNAISKKQRLACALHIPCHWLFDPKAKDLLVFFWMISNTPLQKKYNAIVLEIITFCLFSRKNKIE
jgi:hypothetical protein